MFAPIDLTEWGSLFATGFAWHRGTPFEIVQLLWPDRNGFLPTEPGFDRRLVLAQPVIGAVAGERGLSTPFGVEPSPLVELGCQLVERCLVGGEQSSVAAHRIDRRRGEQRRPTVQSGMSRMMRNAVVNAAIGSAS